MALHSLFNNSVNNSSCKLRIKCSFLTYYCKLKNLKQQQKQATSKNKLNLCTCLSSMQKRFSLPHMGISGCDEALGLIARLLPASSPIVRERTLLANFNFGGGASYLI